MSAPIHAPGGAIPPGVLDPTIVTLRPARRSALDVFASSQGAFAESSRRFMAGYNRRNIRPLNSLHYDGIAGERPHDLFIPELLIDVEIKMVDLDAIQARILQDFALRDPGDYEQPYKTEKQLRERTPQFFLRNVMRVEREVNPHRPPFHIEYYIERELLEHIDTHDFVVSFEIPRPDPFEAKQHVRAWWRSRQELFHALDWEEIHAHDAWRTPELEVRIPTLMRVSGPVRKRGRFANAEEAKAEAKEAARLKRRAVPMSGDDLLDFIHSRSFDGREGEGT